MSWREIKGQEGAVSFLKNILTEGKSSASYLFLGPDGVGKKLAAKNFAKALNCDQEEKNFDCCDQCSSCVKVDSFNHPDVHWIEKPKDKQGISIEQIRNIKREIVFRPYEGKIKIYIIVKAELLTEEASNCLLKTLEEPPASATLILTASDMRKLLPTIISRCKIVRFPSLPPEKIKEILERRLNLSSVTATFLTNLCEGKLGKAIELKDRDILSEKNETINQLTTHRLEFGLVKREEAEEILKFILSWYRDILISKYKTKTPSLINLDRSEEILNLANKVSFDKLNKAIKTVINTYAFIQQNVNPRLALEVMAGELKDA